MPRKVRISASLGGIFGGEFWENEGVVGVCCNKTILGISLSLSLSLGLTYSLTLFLNDPFRTASSLSDLPDGLGMGIEE